MRRATLAFAVLCLAVASCSRGQPVVATTTAARVPSGTAETLPPSRKVVYEGSLDLAVDDLAGADQKLRAEVESRGGFIASSEMRGPGFESASWTLRVPSEKFRETLESIAALGTVASLHTTSQDVSAEFYDTDARMAVQKIEESRLLDHLRESTGSVSELISLEQEIARVRVESETLHTRLNVLGRLADLATLTVTMRQLHAIVSASAPAFVSRLNGITLASAGVLRDCGEWGAFAAGALTPWVLVSAVPALVLRSRWRKRRAR